MDEEAEQGWAGSHQMVGRWITPKIFKERRGESGEILRHFPFGKGSFSGERYAQTRCERTMAFLGNQLFGILPVLS